MTISLQFTVACDTKCGEGQVCGVTLKGNGNAIGAVQAAREAGWVVSRHFATCPVCLHKTSQGHPPPNPTP